MASPLLIELGGTALTQIVYFWLPSGVYLAIPQIFPDFASRHKTQPLAPMPSRAEILHCARVVLQNQLLGLSLQTVVHVVCTAFVGVPPYPMSPAPSPLKVMRDIALCIPICELLFYGMHSFLHRPSLYRRFHKIHHSFTAPVALAAQYAHPLEHVLTCYVPIMIPPLLVRASMFSMWVIVGIVGFESAALHSGYKVGPLAERHDRHHEMGVQGGYGTFEFLDWVFGTEMKSVKLSEKKRQIEGGALEKSEGLQEKGVVAE
jgi:sterol desaturase/sphingolipid hydroxylase (fatty acid hydroxylase superfamily)